MDLLPRIRQLLPDLSPSEHQVAQVVLHQPQAVLHANLLQVAGLAGVSEPTVIRFCRKVGCEGFRDFRLLLAQSLVSTTTYGGVLAAPDDSPAELASKVFDSTIEKLAWLRGTLDHAALEQAIEALATAHKVEFYGLGISGNIAVDGHHKFFRLGVACVAYTEVVMQHLSAQLLAPGDVVVAISNSGEIKELLRSVELASQAGALVISITARGSSLAALSQIALTVETLEHREVYSPIISRVPHLLVLDVLAIGVALRGHRLPQVDLS